MRICGLITEYNPFHNGHLHHLEAAKALTGADAVVAVMSGHFLQRGEPAIMDKWTRAKQAVQAGVNLVIELPVYFSTASAEGFAVGAVALLEQLGVTDLVFGSESGDIEEIKAYAHAIDNPSEAYSVALNESLDQGEGYHVAREKAVATMLSETMAIRANTKGDEDAKDGRGAQNLQLKANNILGIEYVRAINRLGAKITPHTIKRIGNDYNDPLVTSSIASATAIRNLLKKRPIDWDLLRAVMPESTYQGILAYPIYTELNDFKSLFNGIALREGAKGLRRIRDMREGLENRILAELTQVGTLTDMVLDIKSKRYTFTRIQRLLIGTLLGIEAMTETESLQYLDYARVLAFDAEGAKALRSIKSDTALAIFTNVAQDLKKYRKKNPLIQLDFLATDMYAQVNYTVQMGSDYTKKPFCAYRDI